MGKCDMTFERSGPAERAESCVVAMRELGYGRACSIGRILAQGDALEPILLVE